MPDITMCTNEDCPQRWQCYRAQATPKEIGQSYAKYSPTITAHMGFDCRGFEPRPKRATDTTGVDHE